MQLRSLLFSLTLLLAFRASAEEKECPPPWFTGPILTPSADIVPGGYVNIEPYFFYTTTTGRYNDHWSTVSTPNFIESNFQIPTYIGLTSWADIEITPQASWNETQGVSSFEFNDFIAQFSFQLLSDTHHNTSPSLRLFIQETFPTGRFQKLKPKKLGTDIGGEGSFQTAFGFGASKLYELPNCHWLRFRLYGDITFPTSVNVKGVNAYGGAPDTDARVRPKWWCELLGSFEYTFNQNWVLACDIDILYRNKVTASGFQGTLPSGAPAPLGKPKSFQLSFAPALEYNFNANVGLLGGIWVSAAGRNSARFLSGVIALNYFGPERTKEHRFRASGGGSSGGGGGR